MKIFDVGNDACTRRLKLVDGELGWERERGYLFVCKDKEDIVLIWEYIREAITRGIDVFQSATKDMIVKADDKERTATMTKLPIFTFVPGNTKDDAWIRDVIEEILKREK